MDRIISNDPAPTTLEGGTGFPASEPAPPAVGPTCPSWCEVGMKKHLADRDLKGFWHHHQDVRDDEHVTVHLDASEDFDGKIWPATVYIHVKGDDLSAAEALGVAKHILAATEQLAAS